jgi:3-hydroxyacyl-CoA dehydrogenase/enoyl-CoA hydratase/3-hydroxybutyryl-CoA epimerase
MPVGPLAVSDEVNLQLMLSICEDPNLTAHEIKLKNTLAGIIETHQRTGKKEGQGFMIIQNGKKIDLERMGNHLSPQDSYDEEEVGKDCLPWLSIRKCLDSGVIREPKDADVGSILGLGFPVYTGGGCLTLIMWSS